MDVRKLADDFSVAGQISTDDIAAIAQAGYKTILCNRPDLEAFDQPAFHAIEQAAVAAGLRTAFIPVAGTGVTLENVAALASELERLPKPIFAYCRSGARSATLWSLACQHLQKNAPPDPS